RGLIFQEHARTLLHQVENLLHELNGQPGELRGALRLGVIPVLNVPLVPQLLGAFVADHPAISVTVEEISSTEIETALEDGRVDAKDRVARPRKSEVNGHPFAGKKSRVGYRSVAAERLSSKHSGCRLHEPRKGVRSETGQALKAVRATIVAHGRPRYSVRAETR